MYQTKFKIYFSLKNILYMIANIKFQKFNIAMSAWKTKNTTGRFFLKPFRSSKKKKKRYKNTSLKNASLLGAKKTFGNNNYMHQQMHAVHHQHLYLGTCMGQLNQRHISGRGCQNSKCTLHTGRVTKALKVEALGRAAHSPNDYYVKREACLNRQHKLEDWVPHTISQCCLFSCSE